MNRPVGLLHTRRVREFECKPFDVACVQYGHSHSRTQVPFALRRVARPVWMRPSEAYFGFEEEEEPKSWLQTESRSDHNPLQTKVSFDSIFSLSFHLCELQNISHVFMGIPQWMFLLAMVQAMVLMPMQTINFTIPCICIKGESVFSLIAYDLVITCSSLLCHVPRSEYGGIQ